MGDKIVADDQTIDEPLDGDQEEEFGDTFDHPDAGGAPLIGEKLTYSSLDNSIPTESAEDHQNISGLCF